MTVSTPHALQLTGESSVQVRTPSARTRRPPLPTGGSCSHSAPSPCPMHGIQVGTSVIHNWVGVPHSANNLFCALLYGMLLQEVPVSAALRRVEERCLGYSPSDNLDEPNSPMNRVGETSDACSFVVDLRFGLLFTLGTLHSEKE
jgi:hypothetical protein